MLAQRADAMGAAPPVVPRPAFLAAGALESPTDSHRQSDPGGVAAISRGLSAATPPVTWRAMESRPRRGRSRTGDRRRIDRRFSPGNRRLFRPRHSLAPLRGAIRFLTREPGVSLRSTPG